MAFDFTDHDAVLAGVDRIESSLGLIDILINNEGMQFRRPLAEFPVGRWEQLLRTNFSSVFFTGQAVARHMIARGRGKIVNIASATPACRLGLACGFDHDVLPDRGRHIAIALGTVTIECGARQQH